MKRIATHLKNRKTKNGISQLKSKTRAVSSDTSKHKTVISGGLMHVEINRSQITGGSVHFMRASSKKNNSQGVFVAGGDEIDRLVASANEKIYSFTTKPILKKKKFSVLKDIFQHK